MFECSSGRDFITVHDHRWWNKELEPPLFRGLTARLAVGGSGIVPFPIPLISFDDSYRFQFTVIYKFEDQEVFFLFSIYGELDENKKQKIKSLKDIKIYDETKKISWEEELNLSRTNKINFDL